ncbi:MAG: iron ABC transporter permease [Desulfovibrio sp.]|nr:iron ABC transporter permease [Desulfovibrio sp.]
MHLFSSAKHPFFLLFLLFLFWLLVLFWACFQGAYTLSWEKIFCSFLSFFQKGDLTDPMANHILLQIRAPRVLLAALSGGILALSGLLLQGVLKNPLADPFTLGLSQGAACGASLAIVGIIPPLSFAPCVKTSITALAAFGGALIAISGTLWFGKKGHRFDHTRIILAGVAVATILGSLVALIKALNEESIASIVFWVMGSFQGVFWDDMPILLLPLVPGLFVIMGTWRSLDLFFLDDEQAIPIGLNAHRTRIMILLAASLMTAGCVAIAGVIGFVGLIVPHILRLLLGPLHAPLFFASFLGGGILLVLSDVLARTLLENGQEIPVGVVTALLGGPFFAFLVKGRS